VGNAATLSGEQQGDVGITKRFCMTSPERKHPFKLVTRDNWLAPDPVSTAFVQLVHRNGSVKPMDGADWIDTVAATRMSNNVPLDVQNAFEFAKGGLGYGYFYYPLITIVGQQALRVADFSIDQLFVERGISPRPQSMARKIRRLRQDSLIDDAQFQRWDALRQLRNSATHPDFQHVWLPADAVRTFRIVAEMVSALPWLNGPAVERETG
jgi:hypothetical protein